MFKVRDLLDVNLNNDSKNKNAQIPFKFQEFIIKLTHLNNIFQC